MIESTEHYKDEHKLLLRSLEIEDFSKALVCMVGLKYLNAPNIVAHPHCIEISGEDFCICIIIYSGFEKYDFNDVKMRTNLILITFYPILLEMLEFQALKIKLIQPVDFALTVLRLSEDYYGKLVNNIINLN